jgi:nucleoside-diphosphate-sugar epimerase
LKIFMAGATGVIGRRAVPLLIAGGHSVTGIGRSANKCAGLEQAGAGSVDVDVFDADALATAIAGHDVVVNLATHIPSGLRIFLPWAWRENDRLRRVASANLAGAAMAGGAQRFIQESFAPTYPDSGDRWIDEQVILAPTSYNRTVLDAERAAADFTARGGTGVVLRFAAFYGPDAEQSATMIQAVRRGWAPLPGAAENYLSSVTHDDAASAVAAALTAPAGAYNVTDDVPLSRHDFFEAIAAAIDVAPPRPLPRWVTPLFGSLGEILSRSLRISNGKLRTATGWTPASPSAREGWAATVAAMHHGGAM